MEVGDVVILKGDRNYYRPLRMTVEKVAEGGLISCIFIRGYELTRFEILKDCLEVLPKT